MCLFNNNVKIKFILYMWQAKNKHALPQAHLGLIYRDVRTRGFLLIGYIGCFADAVAIAK